jgi:hypothetical protein
VWLSAEHPDVSVWIKDLSATGAKIRIPSDRILPKTFELLMVEENLRFSAALRWREGDMAGVEFVGPPRHISAGND